MSKLSYFEYTNTEMSPSLVIAIHETIQENRAYAGVIWKSRADDAIDATLHHAMKYYSPDKGELRNYIVSTLKNILKNSFKKEHSTEDETLNFLVDSAQEQDDGGLDEMLTDFTEDVSECIIEFLPHVVDDYEFFNELKKTKMKHDYSDILSKYSSKTVVSALHALKTIYLPKITSFMFKAPISNLYTRRIPLSDTKEKYLSPVKVISMVQRTVLVEGYSPKDLVRVDFSRLAEALLSKVYVSGSGLYLDFEGNRYYRSPSWDICSSKEEITLALKEYCLNYMCKRLGFLVASEGNDLVYLLGNSSNFTIKLFNVEYVVPYEQVTRKEVVC